jgi:hypothetical protein
MLSWQHVCSSIKGLLKTIFLKSVSNEEIDNAVIVHFNNGLTAFWPARFMHLIYIWRRATCDTDSVLKYKQQINIQSK